MNGFTHDIDGNWEKASRLEWLETNGLGGWASSSVAGANTRRYHGLLVAATQPPVGRVVLLSKLDERIEVDGTWHDLASNQFPGAVHPNGVASLQRFRRDLFPQFDYSTGAAKLRKSVAAIHGENTTVIIYELVEGEEATLELRPFLAARDYHSLTSANDSFRRDGSYEGDVFTLQPYATSPTLHLQIPNASFEAKGDWYYRFEYPIELERGLDAHEDLFTPGTFTLKLQRGVPIAIVASTDEVTGRDGLQLVENERRRRERVIKNSAAGGKLGRALTLAADQFIVRRGADGRTVIAGYHWFTDWGRDTMIALPGLCLATGRFEDARKILAAFAASASQGMLPNRFPDGGEEPEYNTVDATLWFFVAVRKYLEATADEQFVRGEMLPLLRDIVAWHVRGTRHGIREDVDGLLLAGSEGDQLTWMDAKVGDWVITPRHGKAVEINALWYNALLILSELEHRWGSESAARQLLISAERVRTRFRQLFWDEQRGSLSDVIRGSEHDDALRPNQLFALTLPYPLFDDGEAESILTSIERDLLTPVGLRSLSPHDPRFIPRYLGPPRDRDGAYHQGTVWSWLLGPYVTALARVRGERGISAGFKLIAALEAHLADACVGSISEIFDATEPFAPRGCVAQAWSVGEVLRAMTEDLGLRRSSAKAAQERRVDL